MDQETDTAMAGEDALASSNGGGGVATVPDASVLNRVRSLLGSLLKGLRAQQLYRTNNESLRRFMVQLRDDFEGLWESLDELTLTVEDHAFRWADNPISIGEGRDDLAFLFYRDGIRQLTFMSEFEESELERFLAVLNRARVMDRTEDDLVTLLWQEDFSRFRHVYVDVLAAGTEVPDEVDEPAGQIDPANLRADVAEIEPNTAPDPGQSRAADAPPPPGVSKEDLEETLYFLDDAELRKLQEEMDREWLRDVRGAVLDALFDRLEDPMPERRSEVLQILQELLANYLLHGDFTNAVNILQELERILKREGLLSADERDAVGSLFEALSQRELLTPLVESLSDGRFDPNPETLSLFFGKLRPDALPVLLAGAARTENAEARKRLEGVIGELAGRYPDATLELLGMDHPAIVAGAARLAGSIGLKDAVPHLARLLKKTSGEVQAAALDALAELRTADALGAVQRALDYKDRDIRIRAVRHLGTLRYAPARETIEEVLRGRGFRKADLTEKKAFVDAYAGTAGAAALPLLDRFLNRGGLFRRGYPADLRACAAEALGAINAPAARDALARAGDVSEPTVRRAVERALAGGDGV